MLENELFFFIKTAEKVGQLEQARLYIEEIDGLTKIEKLQENENEEVYKLAYHMVEKFFSDEDDVSLILYLIVFLEIYFYCMLIFLRIWMMRVCSRRQLLTSTTSAPTS